MHSSIPIRRRIVRYGAFTPDRLRAWFAALDRFVDMPFMEDGRR